MIRRHFSPNKDNFNPDKYLTIVALEDGLTIQCQGGIFYKIENGAWAFLSPKTDSKNINKGERMYIKSEWSARPEWYTSIGCISISKNCNLEGNCFSLIFGDNADKMDESTNIPEDIFTDLFAFNNTIIEVSPSFLPATKLSDSCYAYMFRSCHNLTTAPALPATTLVSNCYNSMFSDCTSLTTAPELPATTLASNCYGGMFYGCSSLTTAPALPATTLADSCYYAMFKNCTSLITAPELPATTLVIYCYSSMFYGCSKLNYIKMLATYIYVTNCLSYWVSGVAATGTFVKNPDATWDRVGVDGVPSGWTVKFDGEESGGGLLKFTVDGVAYQFEDGMTWKDWCDSSYNTGGFIYDWTENGYGIYTSDYEKFFIYGLNDSSLVTTGVYLTETVYWPI